MEEHTQPTSQKTMSRSRRRIASATDTRHINSGFRSTFLSEDDSEHAHSLTLSERSSTVTPTSDLSSFNYEEDINDPEWTVQSSACEELGAQIGGLVLKLSKR